jgi:hypothetical protein
MGDAGVTSPKMHLYLYKPSKKGTKKRWGDVEYNGNLALS